MKKSSAQKVVSISADKCKDQGNGRLAGQAPAPALPNLRETGSELTPGRLRLPSQPISRSDHVLASIFVTVRVHSDDWKANATIKGTAIQWVRAAAGL
jgi:hypothetical protein